MGYGSGVMGYRLMRNSSEGFTLLELIISISMTGIIIVIIAGAMRLGLQAVDKGEKRIDSLERIRTSISIMDSQIQSQTPLTFEENGEKRYYFQGDGESMQLSTNYSIWSGQKGYVLVKYKVETDSEGKKILTASENVMGMAESRSTELFKSLDAIAFEYFQKDPTKEEGSWVEKWTDTVNIPEKVKLQLVSGGKDFSMIIPMRTSGTLTKASSIPSGQK